MSDPAASGTDTKLVAQVPQPVIICRRAFQLHIAFMHDRD